MDFEIENPSPPAPSESQRSDGASSVSQKPAFEIRAQSARTTSEGKPNLWKMLRWLSRFGLAAGVILYVVGTFYTKKFDEKLTIENSVRRDPLQRPLEEESFPFEYRGHRYEIQPVASYDISGLVVTHNDISSIMDAYHTSDSVDFRDICVVWGENVESGVFRRLQFWSMPWSCHVKSADRATYDEFVEEQLSNNHLLAADEGVRQTIVQMKVGDQIRLKGKLINYWHVDHPEYIRKSSLTRQDTGDGACEVLWVEDAEILRPSASNWKMLQSWGSALVIGSLALSILLFFVTPLGAYRTFR